MLKWALIFFVISIIAGFFGFSGVSAATATIARVLFGIALVIFLIFLVLALMAGQAILRSVAEPFEDIGAAPLLHAALHLCCRTSRLVRPCMEHG